jgi:hypothetical protein
MPGSPKGDAPVEVDNDWGGSESSSRYYSGKVALDTIVAANNVAKAAYRILVQFAFFFACFAYRRPLKASPSAELGPVLGVNVGTLCANIVAATSPLAVGDLGSWLSRLDPLHCRTACAF